MCCILAAALADLLFRQKHDYISSRFTVLVYFRTAVEEMLN